MARVLLDKFIRIHGVRLRLLQFMECWNDSPSPKLVCSRLGVPQQKYRQVAERARYWRALGYKFKLMRPSSKPQAIPCEQKAVQYIVEPRTLRVGRRRREVFGL